MSDMQKDSEQRIATYQQQYNDEQARGKRAAFKKALEDEQRTLAMIVRVERLNAEVTR